VTHGRIDAAVAPATSLPSSVSGGTIEGTLDEAVPEDREHAMRDPFSWSFPLVPVFGIMVRIHLLMPIVLAALVLRTTIGDRFLPNTWQDAAMVVGLLFASVLLHEFGHCFAARRVDGEANEVLLWPLGGLARVELPHTPSAHFITAAAGPLVNLALCAVCVGMLAVLFGDHHYRPSFNPLWSPWRVNALGEIHLYTWGAWEPLREPSGALGPIVLMRLFYVNWILLLLNVALIGFPMDGGRMFQSVLWPRVGYRQATFYAIVAGFICMFALIIVSIAMEEVLMIFLAFFIYLACKQEWIVLETGAEDSVFGYDFSQGYTSLEREDTPPVKKRQPNFIQRWLRKRAERKRQLEQEQQVAEEQRMDELLEKIQLHGKESLTDEEHRFLKRVANRYRKKSP
jgi:Zn-dependent protease